MGLRERNKIYFWGLIIFLIGWFIVWLIVKVFDAIF